MMLADRALYRQAKRLASGRQRGFTLIELMLVMMIIGVLTTLLYISPGQVGYEDKIEEESRRLAALLELALEEAILETKELGLVVNEKEYAFLIFEDNQWAPISADELLRQRKLADPLEMELIVEGEIVDELSLDVDTEKLTPQIYILSSGELTPFEITMFVENLEFEFSIKGDYLGNIEADIKRPNGED